MVIGPNLQSDTFPRHSVYSVYSVCSVYSSRRKPNIAIASPVTNVVPPNPIISYDLEDRSGAGCNYWRDIKAGN